MGRASGFCDSRTFPPSSPWTEQGSDTSTRWFWGNVSETDSSSVGTPPPTVPSEQGSLSPAASLKLSTSAAAAREPVIATSGSELFTAEDPGVLAFPSLWNTLLAVGRLTASLSKWKPFPLCSPFPLPRTTATWQMLCVLCAVAASRQTKPGGHARPGQPPWLAAQAHHWPVGQAFGSDVFFD